MLADALGRDEVIRAARARTALREWDKIVGPALADRSHPEKFERGTVWVAVAGSAWAQELRMQKEVILKRLRAQVGSESIFVDIRFGVRPLPDKTAEIEIVEVPREDLDHLTIREIAERRLNSWPK